MHAYFKFQACILNLHLIIDVQRIKVKKLVFYFILLQYEYDFYMFYHAKIEKISGFSLMYWSCNSGKE